MFFFFLHLNYIFKVHENPLLKIFVKSQYDIVLINRDSDYLFFLP